MAHENFFLTRNPLSVCRTGGGRIGGGGGGVQRSTKKEQTRTDSNIPTGPNEAVRVATLLL